MGVDWGGDRPEELVVSESLVVSPLGACQGLMQMYFSFIFSIQRRPYLVYKVIVSIKFNNV